MLKQRDDDKEDELNELSRLKNFEAAAYGGDSSKSVLRKDSKPAPVVSKVPGISKESKRIEKRDSMIKHINKIANKSG